MIREYESLERDFTSHVVFETKKFLVHLIKDRRLGCWTLKSDLTGPMPIRYQGKYTRLDLAIDAAKEYIKSKNGIILQGPVPFSKELVD